MKLLGMAFCVLTCLFWLFYIVSFPKVESSLDHEKPEKNSNIEVDKKTYEPDNYFLHEKGIQLFFLSQPFFDNSLRSCIRWMDYMEVFPDKIYKNKNNKRSDINPYKFYANTILSEKAKDLKENLCHSINISNNQIVNINIEASLFYNSLELIIQKIEYFVCKYPHDKAFGLSLYLTNCFFDKISQTVLLEFDELVSPDLHHFFNDTNRFINELYTYEDEIKTSEMDIPEEILIENSYTLIKNIIKYFESTLEYKKYDVTGQETVLINEYTFFDDVETKPIEIMLVLNTPTKSVSMNDIQFAMRFIISNIFNLKKVNNKYFEIINDGNDMMSKAKKEFFENMTSAIYSENKSMEEKKTYKTNFKHFHCITKKEGEIILFIILNEEF